MQHEDNNNNFVRINHVNNEYKVIYSHGTFFRRLSFFGTDGSVHQFSIQIPAGRNARREERIMQLLRLLNWLVRVSGIVARVDLTTQLPCVRSPLASRKESRKRGLQFNVPAIVPFSAGVRIIENDDSITSLQDVYEQHCRSIGISREDPILAFTERIQALYKQAPTPDVRLHSFRSFLPVAGLTFSMVCSARLSLSADRRSTRRSRTRWYQTPSCRRFVQRASFRRDLVLTFLVARSIST